MPSTVVHLSIAALLAAALLAEAFDARALAAVLAVTAFPELDTFLGFAIRGAHRAALHNLLVPFLLAALIAYDLRREESLLRRRGPRAVRVAWVCVAAYLLAAIGPDLFFNGVNLLYPLHDRFYELSGNLLLSDQRGFVQTIWEPPAPDAAGRSGSAVGTTENVHYSTGVDPSPGTEPADVERIFPIARGGLQVLLVLTALVVASVRLWESRKR